MIHELKILKRFYNLILMGKKRFEVRYNDRGFQAGDELFLREYHNGEYTGRRCHVSVTYLLIVNTTMFDQTGAHAIMSISDPRVILPEPRTKYVYKCDDCSAQFEAETIEQCPHCKGVNLEVNHR